MSGSIGPTPVQYCSGLSAFLGIELYFKRDDYLPGPGGGNKVRLVTSTLNKVSGLREFDALVATGGVRSNLARIVASVAGANGWRCKLVLHGSEREPEPHVEMLRVLGAEVYVVPAEAVARELERACEELRAGGLRPLLIQGGASSVEGALGYVEAANELMAQERELGLEFGSIIVPSGTGGTQAGLACGFGMSCSARKIFGISVARSNPRGRDAVSALTKALAEHLAIDRIPEVTFLDEWTFGGYEKTSEELWRCIRLAGEKGGVLLDPTYTGKAFAGLLGLVDSGVIAKGSPVLFWHTGGLMNLYSSLSRSV